METMTIKGGIEIIGAIAAEWIELCEEGASNDPFLRPEWFLSFVKNFDTEIELVTVRSGGKLRALLPLISKRGNIHGIPVRNLQAVFNLNTPRFDLVHGADESQRIQIIEALWGEIKKRSAWDMIEIRLVKKDSWLDDLLVIAASEKYPTGIWPMDNAPFIELPESVDSHGVEIYFKGPRKHFGKELDRRTRRLSELGQVEFHVTNEYSFDLIKRYLDLENLGWKGCGGTAAVLDKNATALHHDFACASELNGHLHAYELRLDGKTIGMSLNVRTGNTMFHWRTSFDEAYSKYSPGNLLFRKLFFDCLAQNVDEIDFLSPSTPNKLTWATGEREHVAFYIFQRGFTGWLVRGWKFSVIDRIRRIRSRHRRRGR